MMLLINGYVSDGFQFWSVYKDVDALGWALTTTFVGITFGWIFLSSVIMVMLPEQENILRFYVTMSNVSMLGPLGLYWITLLMIMIGWGIGLANDGFSLRGFLYLVLWFVTCVAGSVLQWAWIDDVRALYDGDKDVGTENIDGWHDDHPLGDEDVSERVEETEEIRLPF